MKKILLVGVLALVALAMAGCGPQAASSVAFKDDDSTIKIGAILPITGAISYYGEGCRDGIKLAFDQINKAGGIMGKQLELIAEDDEFNAEKTVSAYKKLTTQDKVKIIIGGLTSGNTLAITSLAQEDGVILLSPTATQDTITDAGDFIFRACYKDSFQGAVIAYEAYKNRGLKKGAVIYDIANDYSIGLKDNFIKKFKDLGGEIVAEESYSKGDKDFNAQLTKIKDSGAEVLLAADYYSTVALILAQARALGLKIPLTGGDGWDEIITSSTSTDGVGCFYTNHYSPDQDDPEVKAFIADYMSAFGSPSAPNALAALAYDSALIIADAIKAANTNDLLKIREALLKTDKKYVTGQIKFGSDRTPVKPVVVLELAHDGKGLVAKYSSTVRPEDL